MRIVQLVETLQVGGLERPAVALALTLKITGHQVSMYCLFGAGPLRSDLDAASIPVTEFHKEERSKLSLVWDMARQLRLDHADVIHGHNPGVHHFAAAAKRMAGVPVCVNTRHSAATSTGEPYQERYFRWVAPWTGSSRSMSPWISTSRNRQTHQGDISRCRFPIKTPHSSNSSRSVPATIHS